MDRDPVVQRSLNQQESTRKSSTDSTQEYIARLEAELRSLRGESGHASLFRAISRFESAIVAHHYYDGMAVSSKNYVQFFLNRNLKGMLTNLFKLPMYFKVLMLFTIPRQYVLCLSCSLHQGGRRAGNINGRRSLARYNPETRK